MIKSGKSLLIEVYHVKELLTSNRKMLELLELDLHNQSYGYLNLNKSQRTICMDINPWHDHDKRPRKNTFDLSVPCEWGHYKIYKNSSIVGIGPSKPKLWLIELEQITTKPFAWMLIYDTITTNFKGKNTFDLSVPCVWAHCNIYKTAWIGGIGLS